MQTERDGLVTIHADPGGSITKRRVEIAEMNRSGKRYRIAGHCVSSCTMFLGLDRVCVEPDARFEFHSPHIPRGVVGVAWWPTEMNAQDHRIYVAQMMQHYPPGIREAVRPALDVIHTHAAYTGAELHAIDPEGVRLCG